MLYIKIDYSEECKRTGKRNIPGEFVIYTKKHFWEKWVPGQRYADYDWAVRDAEELRKLNRNLPKYF